MTEPVESADIEEARDRARKALALPVGLGSPLWFAFGAAVSAGVTWWWATRWTRMTNLEAMGDAPTVIAERVEVLVEDSEAVADDLTRLTGIGPKLAQALAERGVTTFAQLAAWTEEQAEALDAELSLKGRIARDAWVAQAKRRASESREA